MSKEQKSKIIKVLLRILLFAAVVLVILPLIWTFISALKDNNEISQYPMAVSYTHLPVQRSWQRRKSRRAQRKICAEGRKREPRGRNAS